jgi:hypothetical protein
MSISKPELLAAIIYNELHENGLPMRVNDLWILTKDKIGVDKTSKGTFYKAVDVLENNQLIERIQRSRKDVRLQLTRIRPTGELGILIQSSPFRFSPKIIIECMEWLISNEEFQDPSAATSTAMNFWLDRFYDLCFYGMIRNTLHLRNAQRSLPQEQREHLLDKSRLFFELYFHRIRKYVEVLTLFTRRHRRDVDGFLSDNWLLYSHISGFESYVSSLEKLLKKSHNVVYEKIKEKNGFEELLKEMKSKYKIPEEYYCRSMKQNVSIVECKDKVLRGICKEDDKGECRHRLKLEETSPQE